MNFFKYKHLFLLTCLILLCFKPQNLSAHNQISINYLQIHVLQSHENLLSTDLDRPNPLQVLFKKRLSKNKKITAAILAFPLPFGIVGLHRIYLGCAPHIPIVYIASLGGAFGILPLIDFIFLLKAEDINQYNNNEQVFMWVD